MTAPHTLTPRGSPPAVPRLAHRVPLLGVGAVALLVAGCGPDAPTEPTATITPAEAPAAAIAAAAAELPMSRLAIVNEGVDDATARLLPSLSDAVAAAKLQGLLRDLAVQLASGDETRARRSLARAREATRGGDASHAPDLAAIDLVLDHAEALLDDDTQVVAP